MTQIQSTDITDGSITAAKLAPGAAVPASNSITPAQLTTAVAGSGLTGGNGSALSVMVDNASLYITGNTISVKPVGITPALLATSVAGSGLTGGAGTALAVNVDTTTLHIVSNVISVNTISASNISNNTITGVKLVNGTITNTQISSGTIRGSTSNAGSAQEIAQGTIGTIDLRANAVSQILTSSSGSPTYASVTPTTKTITTTGGTILVFASLAVTSSGGSGSLVTIVNACISRGGTAVTGAQAQQGVSYNSGANIGSTYHSLTLMGVEALAAGTYTYSLTYNGSGVPTYTTQSYSLTVIELKA